MSDLFIKEKKWEPVIRFNNNLTYATNQKTDRKRVTLNVPFRLIRKAFARSEKSGISEYILNVFSGYKLQNTFSSKEKKKEFFSDDSLKIKFYR